MEKPDGNISWGTFGTSKEKVEVKERVILTAEQLEAKKLELVNKCKELQELTNSLYTEASSKEVYDAIVTLDSAKRALNLIHVKSNLIDKTIVKND